MVREVYADQLLLYLGQGIVWKGRERERDSEPR